jgi:MFS family permease
MYVPSIGIISHYFHRRRAVAIGIVASVCRVFIISTQHVGTDQKQGSALGGTLHPIMLNHLFHGPVGFRWGVRMSAGLLAGLLAVAVLLMKPRVPLTSRNQGSITGSLLIFVRDLPYVLVVIGLE